MESLTKVRKPRALPSEAEPGTRVPSPDEAAGEPSLQGGRLLLQTLAALITRYLYFCFAHDVWLQAACEGDASVTEPRADTTREGLQTMSGSSEGCECTPESVQDRTPNHQEP